MPAYVSKELQKYGCRNFTCSTTETTLDRVYLVDNRDGLYNTSNISDPELLLAYNNFPQLGSIHPSIPYLFVSNVSAEMLDQFIKVTVSYSTRQYNLNPGYESWTWDIATEAQKIYSVFSTAYQQHIPSSENVGVAIGVKDDSVEGVDVMKPAQTLQVEKVYTWISYRDRTTIENMIGKLNANSFFGYAAGEVLLTGCQIRQAETGHMLLTFSFNIKKNPGLQTITLYNGQTYSFTPESGHDYIWFRYIDLSEESGTEVNSANYIQSVHIAQVYDYADFSIFNFYGPFSY